MNASPSLTEFTLYFLRLGAIGFGGPIALAGYMQRDLVEVRRWVSSEEYREGLVLLCYKVQFDVELFSWDHASPRQAHNRGASRHISRAWPTPRGMPIGTRR